MHLVDVVSVAGSEPIAAVVGAGRTRFDELWYDNPEKRARSHGLRSVRHHSPCRDRDNGGPEKPNKLEDKTAGQGSLHVDPDRCRVTCVATKISILNKTLMFIYVTFVS